MILVVYVTKADGTTQPYRIEKIEKTCLRMGSTRAVAESIAKKIDAKIYEGIETRKILQMIFKYLREQKPIVRHQIDLRKALSLLNPAPEFEYYIQLLLSENGYEVTPNQIVKGKCVEHEIDAIARKNGKTCIVEVKHHFNYHTRTSLDVPRISRAVFEDIIEGYEMGLNNLKIDYSMIVCNTKLSEHAKRYANCRGISHIGWSSSTNLGLQTMIEKKKLHPITFLRGLNNETRNKFTSNRIILLKQINELSPAVLRRLTGVPKKKLESVINNAQTILSN